jgi:hypothetical protein
VKKYVVIGAIGLAAAVAGGGATYAVIGQETDEPLAEVGDKFPERGDAKGKSRGSSAARGGGGQFSRHSEVIEQLEIGMSYAEVLAIVGPADHEEVMSSDFGHDVTLWYGSWGVFLSNQVVRSVDYYADA